MKTRLIVKAGQKRVLSRVWSGRETSLSYSVELAGRGAEVTILLLLLGRKSQHLTLDIDVFHRFPKTRCRVLVKGALSGKSNADITGRIRIKPGSVDADAWLAANLLLLSDSASARVMPYLEIADHRVKAGHAVAVSRVNDSQLFYLMSRGLPEKTARAMLVRGFLQAILNEFPPRQAALAEKKLQLAI